MSHQTLAAFFGTRSQINPGLRPWLWERASVQERKENRKRLDFTGPLFLQSLLILSRKLLGNNQIIWLLILGGNRRKITEVSLVRERSPGQDQSRPHKFSDFNVPRFMPTVNVGEILKY